MSLPDRAALGIGETEGLVDSDDRSFDVDRIIESAPCVGRSVRSCVRSSVATGVVMSSLDKVAVGAGECAGLVDLTDKPPDTGRRVGPMFCEGDAFPSGLASIG